MRCALLLICTGIASAAFVVDVPGVLKLVVAVCVALAILFLLYALRARNSVSRIVPALLFYFVGVGWHLNWADKRLDARLPVMLEGKTVLVEGVVTGLPERTMIAQQFQFEILRAPSGFFPRRVVLNYYGGATIVPGQYWRFAVRLNRPHGFANPGGFDYEAWLFSQGISARGYVRVSPESRLLADLFGAGSGEAVYSRSHSLLVLRATFIAGLNRVRYALKSETRELLGDSQYRGLLIALLLGDRSAISQDHWELFTATGSNHLFVISGLHIGMISGFGYWAALFLGKLAGMGAVLPAQKFAAVFALVAAFGYALLAGFTLPTQRAFIMLAVLICGLFWNARYQVSLRLLIAASVVLLLSPLAIVSSGFWLSFVAVASLLAFAGSTHSPLAVQKSEIGLRDRFSSNIGSYVRPQLTVFLALVTPLVFFTQQLSLLAPLVNIVAIPIVGFLILPICLAALLANFVYDPLASLLFGMAHGVISMLVEYMALLLEWSDHSLQFYIAQPDGWNLAALCCAALLLLLPRGAGHKILALPLLIWLMPIPEPLRAPHGDKAVLKIHAVDVGQGLAVIVRTQNHTLLYDTGAQLGADFNLGAAVVVPTLRALDIRSLDAVVVSHGDNDHAGGLSGVEKTVEIGRLFSNRVDLEAGLAVQLCSEQDAWNWDGVEFRFLSTGLQYAAENNSSCVLHIRSSGGSVLLPGDIEKEAEAHLARNYGEKLASTVLLAPHHGSQTSSSYAFLKRVEPHYVVFSAGYRNSFGHPHQRVLARYAEFGVRALNTSASGMISFEFESVGKGSMSKTETPPDAIASPAEYRWQKIRYWH